MTLILEPRHLMSCDFFSFIIVIYCDVESTPKTLIYDV
jgi:hypothetical protein